MKRSLEYIEKIVCAGEGVDDTLLHAPRSHNRAAKRNITDTMQTIMTLGMEFGNTQHEVEEYFARGHPTSICARNSIQNMCDIYKEWKVRVDVYRNIIGCNGNFTAWDVENRINKLRHELLEIQQELNNFAI